jgi:hypothetical protein
LEHNAHNTAGHSFYHLPRLLGVEPDDLITDLTNARASLSRLKLANSVKIACMTMKNPGKNLISVWIVNNLVHAQRTF